VVKPDRTLRLKTEETTLKQKEERKNSLFSKKTASFFSRKQSFREKKKINIRLRQQRYELLWEPSRIFLYDD